MAVVTGNSNTTSYSTVGCADAAGSGSMSTRSDRPGAVRMRRLRERRRRGFRIVSVEVGDAGIDGLIARCLLDRMNRHDDAAVVVALGRLLDGLSPR
jgi:hypothetical protein